MEGDLRPSSVDNIESDLPSSKEEVLERIREVKTGSESGLKDYPLYPRRWMEVNATSGIESAKKIRVMQFNILAEGLSADPERKPPFEDERAGKKADSSTWGNFDSIEEPKVVLNFATRKVRILEEIVRNSPDIVALQEMDRYHDYFGPVLEHLGYESKWSCKLDSPSLKFGYYSDGVCICWKKDRFNLEAEAMDNSVEFEGKQVAVNHVLLTLKPKDWNGVPFVCVATHLKAKATSENEQKRSKQITALLTKVTDFAKLHNAGERILLCGDFNCDPFDIYKSKGEGGRELDYKAICVPHIQESFPNIQSAYPLENAAENADDADSSKWLWTTWKKRSAGGVGEVKHSIDYIYYDKNNFNCTQILLPPDPEYVMEHRLPCYKYPSDHISIVADFDFIR
ncbi:hypothetical protein TrLO_g3882 [Triparma laevis f. longispina]|uniref:Endonuclease/exonuclease/phosphatase domain-containing protein n=1 Tax=Triparma laevis f. longispina TaxID=1714387 RepID=A0A9W7AL77_9STRA|nr:hypothetical protein TrLO_g3882 [Triparma laevis f. longispina]